VTMMMTHDRTCRERSDAILGTEVALTRPW